MKKFLRAITLGVVLTFGINAQAYELSPVEEKIIMYIPNRVMDVLDIFSLSVGVGPVAKIEARGTRLITAGAGTGSSAKLKKGYNRQYGYLVDKGYNLDLFMLTSEKKETVTASRLIKPINLDQVTTATPSDRVFDFYKGSRDYWSVGVSAALLAEVDFDIHIIEVADFFTGIFFIDLKADDLDVYEVAETRELEI